MTARFRQAALLRQRGVAVITALLLTTLAVTIVASLFWQQQVQVRSMENQRLHLQTKWILRGGLDWARLILQQDAIDGKGVVAETGAWATPLAETRLDDYVERERVDNEKFDATISGRVTDAQARYNLRNLANNGQVSTPDVELLKRLLTNLQLNPALAQALATEVMNSQERAKDEKAAQPEAKSSEPLELMRVEDVLAVAGFTPQAVEKLRDFVIVLPENTSAGATAGVNVNTAPPELIAAMVENYTVSQAATLVQWRKRQPFMKIENFNEYLDSAGTKLHKDVKANPSSSYFLVLSHVRLDRAALDAQSLIHRTQKGAVLIWTREN